MTSTKYLLLTAAQRSGPSSASGSSTRASGLEVMPSSMWFPAKAIILRSSASRSSLTARPGPRSTNSDALSIAGRSPSTSTMYESGENVYRISLKNCPPG